MPQNYYVILGIPANSSQEDIKAAYRRRAKKFHPDHYGDNHYPFQKLQEAYSVLSDPVRRRAYDNVLSTSRLPHHRSHPEPMRDSYRDETEPLVPGREPLASGSTGSPAPASRHRGPSVTGRIDSLFSDLTSRMAVFKGIQQNLQVIITLTPEQAMQGGHVRLRLPARTRCPACNGRGRVGFYACHRCRESGFLAGDFPVPINYPPGISDNHAVRLSLADYGMRNFSLLVSFRIHGPGMSHPVMNGRPG
jgi:molecular chaperone DnaJ